MKRFIKQDNGVVIIRDHNDKTLASYSSPLNVIEHPSLEGFVLISTQGTEDSLAVKLDNVDGAGSTPAISATTVSELINALATDFFFEVGGGAGMPPYIISASPAQLNGSTTQNITITGDYFTPDTVFNLGTNVTINSMVSVTPNSVVLSITTGTVAEVINIAAANGSVEHFGSGSVEVTQETVLIPNNTGATLWQGVSGIATTGLGFINVQNGTGWHNSAHFSGVPANTDFVLQFRIQSLGSHSLMVGMARYNTNVNFPVIDFAFYRNSTNDVSIYELGSNAGNVGVANDSVLYTIERVGSTVTYKINSTVKRTKYGATTDALIFDCSIFKYARVHSIELTY